MCVRTPPRFTFCKSVVPETWSACEIITSLVGTVTSPVPFARSSKSAFEAVASTVVPLICTSPMFAVALVIFALAVKLFALISPATVKSFVMLTLLSGTIILPEPLVRNSKSVFPVVVVIKLSSINISSNCAAAPTSKFCVTVTLPVTLVVPVWLVVPTCVTVPVMFVLASVTNPSTVRALSICTLLFGI